MEYKELVDSHVRRRLEDSFGKAVAVLILASATRTSACSIMEPDREGYLRLIDAVCKDGRVIDMWGRSGTETTLAQWRGLADGV